MDLKSRYWRGKHRGRNEKQIKGIQASYSYYQPGFPAKILPFYPVPFSSKHAWVVQREGSREHVGESVEFFPCVNNNCVLPSLLGAQCQFFTCPLLGKYSRSSLLSLLPGRARVQQMSAEGRKDTIVLVPHNI